MRVSSLIVTLLIAVLSQSALAADAPLPTFDVEIIVLRHVNADNGEMIVRRLPVEDGEAERPRRARFEPVAASELKLGSVNSQLLRSSEWSPILHAGWRQPTASHDQAPAMSVAGARGGAQVNGTVRLSLDRFLRLELDLKLDDGSGSPYELRQARRMRSGRVHYFDHPRFGVIALVTPRS